MKTYTSKKDNNITLKAYKYNHKFCLQLTHTDGTVITGQYPTMERANEEFLTAKKKYDLVPSK